MNNERCPYDCPCGNRCTCRSAVAHKLHICSDKTCQCHTAGRYRLELVRDGNGRELYIPQGVRLVRKAVEA